MSYYFDYAAATPVRPEVMQAMGPYFSQLFYNPSALYGPAREARKELDAARAGVASVVGSQRSEIIFTAGGSEANNLAIRGIMEANPGSTMLCSAIEHESVTQPASLYQARHIPVDHEARVKLDKLEELIDDSVALVSVMLANNEVGTIQPIRAIANIVAKIRSDRRLRGVQRPLYLHSDACQAGLWLDLHVSRLGVDLMTLNGGKIYGPKQSGCLFVKSNVVLRPLIVGGGQERNLRSGTENVAFAVGFCRALELAQQNRTQAFEKTKELQQFFFDLIEESLSQVKINGSRRQRLPNNVHLTLAGKDNERLIYELELKGVLAAAGSACSASDELPSHVLKAMGMSDGEAQSSLRFTMGLETDQSAVKAAVAALAG